MHILTFNSCSLFTGLVSSPFSFLAFPNLSITITPFPGDFVTNVKKINSQSDLTLMSSFAGPSYLTVRSSYYVILNSDRIFSLYNPCLTGSSYLHWKPHQCAPRFKEQIKQMLSAIKLSFSAI